MGATVTNINRLFYLVSIYVILTFLWRFLVPAYEESEPDTLIYLEILAELVQVLASLLYSLTCDRVTAGASTD